MAAKPKAVVKSGNSAKVVTPGKPAKTPKKY